jgi:hypothetical protein
MIYRKNGRQTPTDSSSGQAGQTTNVNNCGDAQLNVATQEAL